MGGEGGVCSLILEIFSVLHNKLNCVQVICLLVSYPHYLFISIYIILLSHSVKSLSQKQGHDIIDLCSSSSDDENPPVQFLSLSLDDVKHVESHTQSSSSSSDEGIEYYDGNLALPIFKSGLKGNSLSVVDITQHLLFTDRDDVVCSTIPTNIQDDVVFLVDNTSFENVDDLKSDDLGVWRANKVASDHFHVYG